MWFSAAWGRGASGQGTRIGHDMGKRKTTSLIKSEPEQTAAADLLPDESHATANVSLLGYLMKLCTAVILQNALFQSALEFTFYSPIHTHAHTHTLTLTHTLH